MAAATALTEAIARLDVRFGSRTVVTATAAVERTQQRRYLTGTSFDRLSGGIEPGSALAFVGQGTCGKVTLALRAVAGVQRDGAMTLWIDGARSFDPLAAQRAGVDLRRVVVVRARSREDVLVAAGASLRSQGFRVVVADLGPSFAQVASIDALGPVLPHVRGSTSALVVVADAPARVASIPTYAFERVSWETRHGRTVGWSFAVRRGDVADSQTALLQAI